MPVARASLYAVEAMERRLLLATGSVVINEINYNPADKTAHTEFVELTNPGTTAVDLSGASFVNGIHYTFPAGTTLAAGGFVTVAANPAAIQKAYGVTAFGPWVGSLSNTGEDLTIADAAGNTLDDVNYGVGFPWPLLGDSPGPNYSLELINPTYDNNLGGNWRSYDPSQPTSVTLIPKGATWEYRKGTSEVVGSGTSIPAWRGLEYVESGWTNGALPIGYAPAGGPTMKTTLSDMSGGYSSVFLRKTFYIPDPAEALNLTLSAMYDDGFNVWINGHLAQQVNTPGENIAFNSLASSARTGSDATYHDFTINPTFLQAGDNEIAIQFFNAAKTDTDAYFDAQLTETTGTGGPTPGKQNANYTTATPPLMRQLTLGQQSPLPNTTQTISMKVTDAAGVASVVLAYQTVDAGNYISVQDAAYTNPANWTTVAMHDDGLNGDAVAGDGVYSVTLPASVQVNRRLVRFKVTATGNDGVSITGPYKDDPTPNFAYYVYAGVPAYTAALHPGAGGANGTATTFTPQTIGSLPYLTLLTKKVDHDNAQGIPGNTEPASTGNEYAFTGTLVYNGVVYDNVHYRTRGGVWRYAMGKNMWKFDFQNGHDFQAYYPDGTPYVTTWKKLDLGADIQQGDIGMRGEQGLFETMSFALFNQAGVAAPATIPTTLRIVENASESGTSQYTTDFQGMYLMVEEPDGHYLDAHGLPDGNLYKIDSSSSNQLKNQGKNGPTDFSDLNAFIAQLNNNPSEAWIQANIDLPEFYSFQAVVEMIHHWDIGFGKNYNYYHNPDTGKWDILPWDTDLTWYVNYQPGNGDLTPFANAVLKYPDLQIQYRDRVRELRDTLFNPEMIGKLADAYANEVNPGGGTATLVQADAAMWDYNPIETSSNVNPSKAGAGRYYQGGSPTKDFAGMIAQLKTWAAGRFSYLDNTVITATDNGAAPRKPTVNYTGAPGFPVDGLTFTASAFAPGSTGAAFAGMEWRLADVTNAPGLTPSTEAGAAWDSGVLPTYNATVTVPSTVGLIPGHVYRLRVKMLDANGRWSDWSDVAAGSTHFVATASNAVKNALRVTELHYDPTKPAVGGGGAQYNNDDFEFIELENIAATAISLAGVEFTDGITCTFGSNVTLQPGQVGVLVHNTAAFQSRYGTTPLILGDYLSTGQSFSNGGEHVRIADAFGQTISDFTYDATWYPATKGNGPSLEVINPAVSPDLNLAANWRASATNNGTPGVASTASLAAPTNASATSITPTGVMLQWTDNATTETGYSVFRRTGGGQYAAVATLPANATTFTDANLTPGVHYEYLIQATATGAFSDPADVVVDTRPLAPTHLVGSPSAGSVALSWSVPVGAVTYNVYRGPASGAEGLTPIASNLALPAFTDTTIRTGNNYYYVVTAVNAAGVEGVRSAEVSQLLGATDFYKFDEGTGTTTADMVGTNTGTLVGATLPTWVAGKNGSQALSFSGDGQANKTNESAVQVANDLSPVLGGTASLTAWIQTTQVGNNTHYLAPAITGVEQAGGSNDINWGYLDATGHIGIAVGEGTLVSNAVVNDGQWHQVTLTRDAASGTVQIYVDGKLDATGALGTGAMTSHFKLIGALTNVQGDGVTVTGANYFNGTLENVGIYNAVLSAAQVRSIGLPSSPPLSVAVTPAAGGTELDVSWNDPGAFQTGYRLERRVNGDTWQQIAVLSATKTTYADTAVQPNATYEYRLRSIGQAADSIFYSNIAQTTTPVTFPAPTTVNAVQVTQAPASSSQSSPTSSSTTSTTPSSVTHNVTSSMADAPATQVTPVVAPTATATSAPAPASSDQSRSPVTPTAPSSSTAAPVKTSTKSATTATATTTTTTTNATTTVSQPAPASSPTTAYPVTLTVPVASHHRHHAQRPARAVTPPTPTAVMPKNVSASTTEHHHHRAPPPPSPLDRTGLNPRRFTVPALATIAAPQTAGGRRA